MRTIAYVPADDAICAQLNDLVRTLRGAGYLRGGQAVSEPKWTPGPWIVIEPVALDYRAPCIYGADKQSLVAIAEGGGPKRAVTAREARSNAQLIAAAPELYEALALLLTTRSHPDADRRVTEGLQKGLAALAKAEGDKP